MRAVHGVLLGAIGGAALASAGWALLAVEPVLQPVAVTPRGEPPAAAGADGQNPRLVRIEEQLTRLSAQVSELRDAVAGSVRLPVSAPGDPSIDQAALVAALDRAEVARNDKRLAGLADQELFAEAQRLRRQNPAAARQALEHLLTRAQAPEDRAKALSLLGQLHRSRGDLASSERVLQEALNTVGGVEQDPWLGYELALTVAAGGDHVRALALGESVVRSPDVHEWTRLHGQWVTATMAHELGDTVRARTEYQAILAACGETQRYEWLVRDVTGRLQSLH